MLFAQSRPHLDDCMIGGTENSKMRSAILTTKLVIIRIALRGSRCCRRRLRFLVMKENGQDSCQNTAPLQRRKHVS